mgnify:CR=1 FL=1
MNWPAELAPGSSWKDFLHPVLSRMDRGGRENVEGLLASVEAGQLVVPDYQRDRVWTPQQQAAFVGFTLEGAPLPAIYIREVDTSDGPRDEIVDGQQRMAALKAFTVGEVPAVFPSTGRCAWISGLAWVGWRMVGMPTCRFRGTRAEALSLYLSINSAGTPHTESDLERVRQLLAEAVSPHTSTA